MPFVSRYTDFPSIGQITELEQIVIVDRTPPSTFIGISTGATCLVAEFLKGPFFPTEVFSGSELVGIFGGVSANLSQDSSHLQNTGGVYFEGNGAVELKNKQFRRLVIQRVDQDMTTTDGGSTKAFMAFTVTIDASDQDPDNAAITGRDIVIPAGTRFADDVLLSATEIVMLSQDIIIPKGTAISGGLVGITQNTVNANGDVGATAMFVLNTTASTGSIDTCLDRTLPGVKSTITASGISTINGAGSGTDVFAAGTASATLANKYASLYAVAINRTQPGDTPQDDISVIWAARNTSAIRTALINNAANVSALSARGRIAIVSADIAPGTTSGNASTAKTAAVTLATGTNSDRAVVSFPYVKTTVDELSKSVTVSSGSFMASTLSMFPEEKNPGARNDFIAKIIDGFEDCFQLNPMQRSDYARFKSNGVAALVRDRTNGFQYQSGITTSTVVGRQNIKRRRMADFIQASLAEISAKYNKEPATTERVDAFVGDCNAFLSTLKSADNPSQQRIVDYSLDMKSGNTDEMLALGIFVLVIRVQILASMDDIVLDSTIGEGVDVTIPAA